MDYHRPRTLDEALAFLEEGVPLGGGISLTPRRRDLRSVVDLQDLGLDTLEVTEKGLQAGASVNLQSLVDFESGIPLALREVCRLEAGWNLRNAATLAGTIMAADGRSPLATALSALGTKVVLQPGDESVDLETLWARREGGEMDRLITAVFIPRVRRLSFEYVARSPADRPIVCAAVAETVAESGSPRLLVALGGHGLRPILLSPLEGDPSTEGVVDELSRRASQAYSQAGDAWASAEYRSEIAGVLVRRLLQEGATA